MPPWTQDEQSLLDGALQTVAKDLPSKDRWKQIALKVGNGRTARDCAERVRELRQRIRDGAPAASKSMPDADDEARTDDGGHKSAALGPGRGSAAGKEAAGEAEATATGAAKAASGASLSQFASRCW